MNDQNNFTFGPRLLAADRTRFRLWAPDLQTVQVEVEGSSPIAMTRNGEWFEADADCGAGARYRFRIAPELAIADPASRAQHGDLDGASIVVDPHAYAWQHNNWRGRPWHEAVIYELHIGALGGFRAAIGRLAELAALGVTAIELMPIAEFPGARNWGYDGVLPYAPDASYGSPEDLKALVDAAHGLGLMVFLDVVYNHFGPAGNYLSQYASPFFRKDVHTPWGPAINFSRREVNDFFIENAIYWLTEYRFDGLRFDAVHAIADQEFPPRMAQRIRTAVAADRHVHLVLEHDGNVARYLEHDYNGQWNDDAHHVLHVMLSGEHHGYYQAYANDTAGRLARALQEGFVYQGEVSPFSGEPRGEPSAHLSPTAFVLFLQNHDQIGNRAFGERLICLAQARALRAATALQLLCPHIPLIFMGEEWGCREPFLYFTDHPDELADAVRVGRREEFAKFPDFSDPQKRERIPDPNAVSTFEQSRALPPTSTAGASTNADGDADKWRSFYRNLLSIRAREIFPRLANARALDSKVLGAQAVLARWKMGDGNILSIYCNLGADAVKLDRSVVENNAYVIFETSLGASEDEHAGRLAGYTTIACLEKSQ